MPSVVVETACPIPIINPASLAMDLPGASGADKKRNKLGYSRTSVACVHCRRRKIRCLVAADDSEGRCENCIRLRKECQFYPVDQQPQTDRKARPGITPTSSADPSIASSSPPPAAALAGGAAGPAGPGAAAAAAAGGGASIDPNDIYHYQMSMQSTATTPEMAAAGFHPSGFSVTPMGGAFATSTTNADLVPSQTIDPNAPWDTHPGMGNPSPVMWTTQQGQILAPPPPPPPLPPPHPHAHAHPSSLTASPITATGMPHPQMLNPAAAAAPYTVQPDGTLWPAGPPPPPPQRAMTTIPSQADMFHPHPGFVTGAAAAGGGGGIPPELKRSMTSPGIPRNQQPSPLQSPSASPAHHPHVSQVPVPVNYPPGPAMAFQQPPPQQQWSNMNAIPMADGSYATMFPPPGAEHFPMGQHPATGP